MKSILLKIVKYIKMIVLYIWQLPQNLLGLGVLAIIKKLSEPSIKSYYSVRKLSERYDLEIYVASTDSVMESKFLKFLSGFSLGRYIYLPEWRVDEIITHEVGHTFQSKILGPLYLIVVGIPSAVFCNLWDRVFHGHWSDTERHEWYYSRFPEKWANNLAAKYIKEI